MPTTPRTPTPPDKTTCGQGTYGLVDGEPDLDLVAEGVEHDVGEVGEGRGGVHGLPPALLVQGLGQVPVVQRHGGRDAGVHQRVCEKGEARRFLGGRRGRGAQARA